MSLLISLRSETLKLKRTLLIYLCVSAAVFAALMSFLEYLDLGRAPKMGLSWTDHFMKGREPLGSALLPLYVILICTLLLQIEYRDKTWKQVLSSPQKMINIFFAKFITLQFLILAFLIVYNLLLIITAFCVELMHPDLFNGKADIYGILTKNAQTYILVLGMSAIQFWFSLRFKNFIASLAIGIALWFLAPLMAFMFKTSIVEKYPYAFSMLSEFSKYEANVPTYLWYSILTTLLFLGLAFVEFRIRKVKLS